jgi:hypothetical protein
MTSTSLLTTDTFLPPSSLTEGLYLFLTHTGFPPLLEVSFPHDATAGRTPTNQERMIAYLTDFVKALAISA